MANLVVGKPSNSTVKIDFRQDASSADFLPLGQNPSSPVTVIPVEGVGDMLRSVYDHNLNGVVDSVDVVPIGHVTNLQATINDIYNQIGAGGGGGGGSSQIIFATNTGGESFFPGTPVCKVGAEYLPGKSLAPRQTCLGLAVLASDPGQQLKIQQSGLMTLPASSWDVVTDQVGGLATDQVYYLSDLGKLTNSPPTTEPSYLIKIGYALNNTDLLLDLDLLLQL